MPPSPKCRFGATSGNDTCSARSRCRRLRLAVISPGQNLSYEELLRHADHIYRLISENGVGPGAIVAVCLPRAPLLVTDPWRPAGWVLLPAARSSRHFVRTVLLAGKPVNVHEFEKLLESDEIINFPRIFNLYGNTETTIHTTIKELTRKDLTAGVLSPIGMPVEHAHTLVLDEQRHPVPTEQHGELWIGGAGVARGYVNRPELTAERFVTGLLPELGAVRWYRTGDLVRQPPAGRVRMGSSPAAGPGIR